MNKQIEEMAIELSKVNCKPSGCGFCYLEYGTLENSCEEYLVYKKMAQALYNAGYRKQREGEWKYNPDGMDWGLGAWECSLCRCRNDNLPMQENIKPLCWAGTKYCPNCGAKMKGGE